jgi:c-di-GMP-binding flagellar brake protein YcgR
MAYAVAISAGVLARQPADTLWSEMLSTILDHFRDGRDARILLPLHGQRSIAVDGSVRTADDETLGIALPYDRDFSQLVDPREICQILFTLQGREYRLLTRIQAIPGASDLLVKPKPPAIALQERQYFRIDTRVELSYYRLASEMPQKPHTVNARVNLSGSGIRIPAAEPLQTGDLLAMVLCLDGGKCLENVECLAQVVRFSTLPNGEMAAAMHFVEIENQDRDKIVAFCLARERELLREKVRTRDFY